MKKKKVQDEGFTAQVPARLGPEQIQQKEFSVSRFSGYKMRDVDEFLDEITGAMTLLEEENRRMRSGEGGPMLGAPDMDEVSRQADEILQRARDEAAAIIRDAEARASIIGEGTAAPTPVSGEDKAAITAFLNKERDFLQVLATHVQAHAEGVKDMAKDARAKHAAAARTVTPAVIPSVPPPAMMTQPMPTVAKPARTTQDPGKLTREQAEEPIRVDEPASASVAASEDDPAEGDRSLRELFWGEE